METKQMLRWRHGTEPRGGPYHELIMLAGPHPRRARHPPRRGLPRRRGLSACAGNGRATTIRRTSPGR